mgnify:CR=1 FL=1
MLEAIGGLLFLTAIIGYAVVSALYAAGLAKGNPRLTDRAWYGLGAAHLAHTGVIVLHVLRFSALPLGAPSGMSPGPWDHPLSTLAWVLLAVSGAVGFARPGNRVLGAFVAPVALGLALAGLLSPNVRPVQSMLPDALQSVWFPVHTLGTYGGLAAFSLAFASGIGYLLQAHRLKSKIVVAPGIKLPALSALDKVNSWAFSAGLVLLALGIVSGTFWAATPAAVDVQVRSKAIVTVAIWVIYAVGWQGRLLLGWDGRRTAWLSILGFVGLCVSVLGVAHA